mgnify:CR=1 FL=1
MHDPRERGASATHDSSPTPMQSDVRSIPPAPRHARLRPLLAHRWPLLALGGALVVLGTLIAWAMFLQSGGALDSGRRLEAGPTRTVTGTVTKVLPARAFDGREWNFVHYRFPWSADGQEVEIYGMCFVPAGSHQPDASADVRVLADDGNVHCIVGGVLRAERRWLYARFWLVAMVVPGALILMAWLAGVFQLRQVLVHGDVSVGHVLEVHPVRFVLPEMLVVTYEFRDHHAKVRRNRHWVRTHGALGARLRRGPQGAHGRFEPLPVLHDRRLPQWNRLLLPADFLRTPAGASEARLPL